MPEYQYKCISCNANFSIFKSMTDSKPIYCLNCGSDQVKRVFFPIDAVYKSTGFYKTDERKDLDK